MNDTNSTTTNWKKEEATMMASPAPEKPATGAVGGRPDDNAVMRDVRRLIYEQCADNSIWDHLGSLDGLHRASPKRVHIRESENFVHEDMELLDIPPGLGLLFFAAQADKQTKPTPNLTRLLLIAAAPPPPEDPCHRLYVKHKEQLAKRQASLDAITDRLLKEEMKECTFQPKVSDAAQHLPPKGAQFFEKCLEWKAQAEQRLQKKAAREANDVEEECMKSWTMNEHSKKLAARAAARRAAAAKRDAAEGGEEGDGNPRDGSHSPTEFKRHNKEAERYSFEPTTNSARMRETYITGGSPSGGSLSRRDHNTTDASASTENNDMAGPAQTTASHIVQRLQEDIKAREQRAAERKKHYDALLKEQLYDPESGQPLFQPNALPTRRVGKERIPIHQLPPDEQQALKAKLKRMGMQYITAPQRSLSRQPARNIDEIVAAMASRSKQAETHIEKIKRNELKEQGEWFKPRLEEASLKMAAARVPPHEQALPTKPPPPSPPKRPVSSAKSMDELHRRSEAWTKSKALRIERAAERLRLEQLSECSFKPQRDRDALIHGSRSPSRSASAVTSSTSVGHQASKDDAMVAAAEVRMRNELELLRSHPAYRDPALLDGLRSASLNRQGCSSGAARHARQQYYAHAAAELLERHPLDDPVTRHVVSVGGGADRHDANHLISRSVVAASPLSATYGASSIASPAPVPPILRASGDDSRRGHPVLNLTTVVNQSTTKHMANRSRDDDNRECRETTTTAALRLDPMAALDEGVGELETLLGSWKDLERETDQILDFVTSSSA